MAEPRKVPFVTISSFGTSPALLESKKRRREDEAEITAGGKDGGVGSAAVGAGSGGCVGGLFGNVKGGGDAAGEPEEKPPTTVRLDLSLTEPNERGSAEFNYTELIQSTFTQVKPKAPAVCKGLTPPLDPSDPFADDDRERREVEELAKKFESKYGGVPKKKKRDRMQDLIDIGYGYDETDPFIDNSEAYDELVPASLTTKHGGFYINIGTLQFRPASDSEGEGPSTEANHFKKLKDGEERAVKRRRKKQDGNGNGAEDKKPRKNRVPKQGVSALNVHRPEKKKRKKLMKDSIQLANMLRRFSREKEELRKKIVMGGVAVGIGPPRPAANKAPHPPPLNPPAPHKVAAGGGNDFGGLGAADPAVMSLLGAANDNNDMLQDLMGDLDFGMLDSPQPRSPAAAQGENGGGVGAGPKGGAGASRGPQAGGVLPPPPLPGGLSAPLIKRIEDLRAASRQFDQEGRKKFFTLDMNNILLDIELQVQEQPDLVRSAVYSHLEAFVPCNKEALLKRLKKLSLNIQDDRLRTPLLKLKLAVCSVMPEQIARYNMDCIAKVAKQQSEEGEKNGSEEDDDDKPGKRVMGPRKKFIWDDKLRTLLCNLVRVKLGCYELEGQNSVSPEDYLKAFMETEVKLLWPKGWMQARMLFKESTAAHGHLTGNTAKKKMLQTPKARPKEAGWVQRSTPTLGGVALGVTPPTKRPPQSPSEPIFLDALEEQLAAPSLDSISQALVLLSNAAKGLAHGDSPPSPDASKTSKTASASSLHASPILQQHKKGAAGPPYVSTSSSAAGPLSRTVSSAAAHLAPAHRHAALGPARPATGGLGGGSPSPKPRPPPTASPLVAPGSKPGAGVVSALPSGLLKGGGGNLKATSGDAPFVTSPPPRSHMAPKTPQTTPRLPQTPQTTPRLPQTPHSKPSLSHPLTQSNFITPMHATLTRTSLSSTPPVIKLTPRTPGPAAPRAALAAPRAALASQPHPRPQATPPLRQYSPRGPAAGFRAPFSGAQGAAVKAVAGSYAGPGPALQKQAGGTGTGLTITSSTSKHSGATPSAATATANAVQRQRSAGGTTQGTKPITSVSSPTVTSQLPQVSSAGGGGLLGSPPSLPLGFGMLGGLVPVSLPFQFPPLLSLPTLGTANAGAGAATSQTANSNASFSTLTQNLYKSLQSGAQVALAPHLQLAFSDVNQSQGGDAAKRKAL